MPLTPEQAEERECLAEDREKGRKEDALIEAGIVERFLRGGFKSHTFPGAQLLTSDEHKVICARIQHLQAIEMRRDDLERILVKAERRTLDLAKEVDDLKSKVPTWISVDERLPEDRRPVLVGFQNRGSVIIATYFKDNGFSVHPAGQVTHWMPIPALPNKEGK